MIEHYIEAYVKAQILYSNGDRGQLVTESETDEVWEKSNVRKTIKFTLCFLNIVQTGVYGIFTDIWNFKINIEKIEVFYLSLLIYFLTCHWT